MRTSGRLHAEHWPRHGAWSHNPEIMTWAETKSQTLNQLSHMGAPEPVLFNPHNRCENKAQRGCHLPEVTTWGWCGGHSSPRLAVSGAAAVWTPRRFWEIHIPLCISKLASKTFCLGVPRWLSWLSVGLRLGSWSWGPEMEPPTLGSPYSVGSLLLLLLPLPLLVHTLSLSVK